MTDDPIYIDSYTNLRGEVVQVGDLIHAYHSGVHRVLKIEERPPYKNGIQELPLITYQQVLTKDYVLLKKVNSTNCCDAAYVGKITFDWIEKQRKKLQEETKKKEDGLTLLFRLLPCEFK